MQFYIDIWADADIQPLYMVFILFHTAFSGKLCSLRENVSEAFYLLDSLEHLYHEMRQKHLFTMTMHIVIEIAGLFEALICYTAIHISSNICQYFLLAQKPEEP